MNEEFIPANQLKPKLVLIKISPQEELMIETIKPFAKTKARTKAIKFALAKAYEIYKDMKAV